jgi:hypothetical protein
MTEHIVHQPAFSAIPDHAWRDSLATMHRFAHPLREFGLPRSAGSPRS